MPQKNLLRLLGIFLSFGMLFVAPGVSSGQEASIDLFASGNLDDWDYFLDDPNLAKSDIWEFRDNGVLYCKGMPFGYLATKKTYQNYHLTVQWRWTEECETNNSGIFLRIDGSPETLPRCIECQLCPASAGDLYGFKGRKIDGPKERTTFVQNSGIGDFYKIARTVDAQKPRGEWNEAEVVCQDGVIVVVFNGKIVNFVQNAEIVNGQIGLQSEGGPIEFRQCILTPLP